MVRGRGLTCLLLAQHVHGYVMQEYTRACLISYESSPKDAEREGWGRPGTLPKLAWSRKWEIHTLTVPVLPHRDSLGWSLLPAVSARYRPRSWSVSTHDDSRLLFFS